MFVDKWKPVLAPEAEVGTAEPETPAVGGTPPPEPADGPGSGRSAIRKSLEEGFEKGRKAEAEAVPAKKGKTPRRVAGGAEVEPPEVEAGAEEAPAEGETPAVETAAPEAFSKEAKAEWANVPPTVQAAILKRETDTAKGVEELKGKYKDLDTALSPHMNVIRQNGHTPAQAISQLFAWFQALAGNPDAAFPALAKSFGYDLARFVPKPAPAADQAAAAAAEAAQAAAPAGTVAPEFQKYIDDLKKEMEGIKTEFGKQFGEVKTTFQRESEEKTNAILMNWSKDKPHFEEVRGLMAQMIQSGAVPLKEGQVDLDRAYDMAVFAHPEVRAKVLADQQTAAEKARKDKTDAATKKAQEAADKARKAGVSLGSGAPGAEGAPAVRKGKGKTVRESINEARDQLSE